MSFDPKEWKNDEGGGTPLSAEALKDLEERLAAYADQVGHQPGDVKDTARTTAPEGWLLCDGSAVSRTTYADLFEAIGVTHGGGDGSTTFNLPDYRERVLVGKGSSGDTNSLADNDGLSYGSRGPNHVHTYSGATGAGGTGNTGSSGPAYAVVNRLIKT